MDDDFVENLLGSSKVDVFGETGEKGELAAFEGADFGAFFVVLVFGGGGFGRGGGAGRVGMALSVVSRVRTAGFRGGFGSTVVAMGGFIPTTRRSLGLGASSASPGG